MHGTINIGFESLSQIIGLYEIYFILQKYMENVKLMIGVGLYIRYTTVVTAAVYKHQL